jgi:hypothetical protein
VVGAARGALNHALKQIREYLPDLEDAEAAMVIGVKAEMYRRVYPGVPLTPTALAKHWPQLEALAEQQRRATVRINAPIDPSNCDHCAGHGQVLVFYRPAPNPHPAHAGPLDGFEEYLPCEFCNPTALAEVRNERIRFDRIHGSRPKPPPKEVLDKLGQVIGA